jgi:hypothetical protein
MEMMVGGFVDDPAETVRLPDESNAAYDARLRGIVLRGLLLHPERILGYTGAHFMHNQVQSVLHLPVTAAFQSPAAYVKSLPFWSDWTAPWPAAVGPMLAANLGLLALGLGSAWSRRGALILAPVFLALGYSLTVALARFSGWRYILPADWIVILFYAIGLSQLLQMARALFKDLLPAIGPAPRPAPAASAPRAEWTLLAALALIGLSLPLSELLIPERYAQLDPDRTIEWYAARGAQPGLPSPGALRQFLDQPGAAAFQGVAMYPRYFEAGQGIGEHTWTAYVAREYGRVGFLLMHAEWSQAVLALPEAPSEFPHDEVVFVFGCQAGDHVEARLVIPAETQAGVVYAQGAAPLALSCPEIP